MENKLHSATIVEEALRNNGGLGRHRSQRSTPRNDIRDELLRSTGTDPAVLHEPRRSLCDLRLRGRDVTRRHVGGKSGDLLAELGDAIAEDCRSLRRLSLPEWQRRSSAVSILNQHTTYSLHPLNAPACRTEKNDVTRA